MKILYANHYGKTISGAERVMLNLASGMSKLPDVEITALCPDGVLESEFDALNIPVVQAGFVKFRRTPSPMFWMSAGAAGAGVWSKVFSLARSKNFDVFYSNSYVAHLYCGLPARAAGLKTIWHMHDILKPLGVNRRAVRFASANADAIIAVSDAVKENLATLGANPGKIHTVLNGIDLEGFDRRANAGLESAFPRGVEGGQIVTLVGQVAYFKGQHTFVSAALKLISEGVPATFVIVGGVQDKSEKEYFEKIRERVEKAGAGDRIIFTGLRGDIPAALAASDILVHASATPDPCPLSVIEYLYSGKAVIASRTGGVPELVADGETGLLFQPEDAAGLADSIRRLVTDKQLRDRLGAAARSRATGKHSLSAHSRAVMDVLEKTAVR